MLWWLYAAAVRAVSGGDGVVRYALRVRPRGGGGHDDAGRLVGQVLPRLPLVHPTERLLDRPFLLPAARMGTQIL